MGTYCRPIQVATSETLPRLWGRGTFSQGALQAVRVWAKCQQAERAPRLQHGSRSARCTGVHPAGVGSPGPKGEKCVERQGDGVTGGVA